MCRVSSQNNLCDNRSHMKLASTLFVIASALAFGQASPPASTTVEINGKNITIKYGAPSVKGRQMLGKGGRISKDPTYPVWRLGANSATSLHTDAALDIGGVNVPAGDYTLYAKIDEDPWLLVINKNTGQWGTEYDASKDQGRAKMKMGHPPSKVETMKITLSKTGGNKGELKVEFEDTTATVPIMVK